jgi:hypothetical protein
MSASKGIRVLTWVVLGLLAGASAWADQLKWLATCRVGGMDPVGVYQPEQPESPGAVALISWKAAGPELGAGTISAETVRLPAYWPAAAVPRKDCQESAPAPAPGDGVPVPITLLDYFVGDGTVIDSPEQLHKLICSGDAIPVTMHGICVRSGAGCSKLTLDPQLTPVDPPPGECQGFRINSAKRR